jgi:hypothetical protein
VVARSREIEAQPRHVNEAASSPTPTPPTRERRKSPHRTRKDSSSSIKRREKKKKRRKEIVVRCHYGSDEGMYVLSVTGVSFAVYRALLEYLYTGIYDSLSGLEVWCAQPTVAVVGDAVTCLPSAPLTRVSHRYNAITR